MTEQESQFWIEPHNPSWTQIFLKFFLWLIVWVIVAIFIFVVLILVWPMFQQALRSTSWDWITLNPLLPIILILITFLWMWFANIVIAWIYNMLMWDKYYDMKKMFNFVMISNLLIFFLIFPLYLIFYSQIDVLFMIVSFQIFLSAFVSLNAIEMTTNPNYCTVHLIWNTIWFVLWIVIFCWIFRFTDYNSWEAVYVLLMAPPIISFSIIPLFHWIWESIYYYFYSIWNNFLYVPSISEIVVDEDEDEEINNEDINVN